VATNAIANLGRLLVFGFVALLLPAFLARHLSHDVYNTWALVIQIGAFVSFLEIGIQTAVSKFVAEHHAADDLAEASKVLTNAAMVLAAAGSIGLIAMCVIAAYINRILPEIAPGLVPSARVGILLYGGSLAIGLPASAFAGVFLGLQKNLPVVLLQSAGKLLFATVVVASVMLHAPFADIIALAAGVNLLTAAAQVTMTVTRVPLIAFSISLRNRAIAVTLLKYCSVLAIWSVSMLFVSGLDTTLVAHFEFAATAAYAIAATLTSLIASLQGSVLSPMIPATSALSKKESAEYLGVVLSRFTQYASIIAVLTCVPFLLFGFPLLKLWVGQSLANQGISFLWILSIATAVRQLSLPYSVMVIGLGKQKLATVSPVVEGVVNLICSVLLAEHYGAVGIAYGTLIGAFIGLSIHLLYSMRLTQSVLAVPRPALILQGYIRPAAIALPTLCLLPYWVHLRPLTSTMIAGVFAGTALLVYFVALDPVGRREAWSAFQRLLTKLRRQSGLVTHE
jgi:O-antigen/teichoic acid export membrane protein